MSNAHRLDLGNVRNAIRLLERERLLMLAERAVSELAPEQRLDVLQRFIRLDYLVGASGDDSPSLLRQVQAFDAAARCGKFCGEPLLSIPLEDAPSAALAAFAQDFYRLERACIHAVGCAPDREVRQSFEILFAILRRIAERKGDIVSIDDADRSPPMGLGWRRVMPAYARVLAATASPSDTSSSLDALIRDFGERERGALVDACLRVLPEEHRSAVAHLQMATPLR